MSTRAPKEGSNLKPKTHMFESRLIFGGVSNFKWPQQSVLARKVRTFSNMSEKSERKMRKFWLFILAEFNFVSLVPPLNHLCEIAVKYRGKISRQSYDVYFCPEANSFRYLYRFYFTNLLPVLRQKPKPEIFPNLSHFLTTKEMLNPCSAFGSESTRLEHHHRISGFDR